MEKVSVLYFQIKKGKALNKFKIKKGQGCSLLMSPTVEYKLLSVVTRRGYTFISEIAQMYIQTR